MIEITEVQEIFNKVTGIAIDKSGLTRNKILGISVTLVGELFIVYVEEILEEGTETIPIGVKYSELYGGNQKSDDNENRFNSRY